MFNRKSERLDLMVSKDVKEALKTKARMRGVTVTKLIEDYAKAGMMYKFGSQSMNYSLPLMDSNFTSVNNEVEKFKKGEHTGYINVAGEIINFPDNIKIIDRDLIREMIGDLDRNDLKEVYIPNLVRFIDNNSFEYCENLKRVLLPEFNTLMYIGVCAFIGCKKLESFDFKYGYDLRFLRDCAFFHTKITEEQINEIPYCEDVYKGKYLTGMISRDSDEVIEDVELEEKKDVESINSK